MSEPVGYEIPVPENLNTIRAIHDGRRWLQNIVPGSVLYANGALYFTVKWRGSGNKQFVLATDVIGGYECEASR